ncbi:MAG: glycine cleavage system protein H [Syntrophobacteraceae bacterium]
MSTDIHYDDVNLGSDSGELPRKNLMQSGEGNPPRRTSSDLGDTIWDRGGQRTHTHRPCLHSLAGRVGARSCTRDYRCDTCEFDQLVEKSHLMYPKKCKSIVEIDGYRHSEHCHYHRGHSWTHLEYGGNVRIGIDDFAARIIGFADAIELPLAGTRIFPGVPAFSLKRDRHWVRVLSPIQGTVLSVNETVLENPELIRTDSFETGWLALVKPDSESIHCPSLAHGEEAKEWLAQECGFLKVLLSSGLGGRMGLGNPTRCAVISDWVWVTLVETFLHTKVIFDPPSPPVSERVHATREQRR